MFRTKKRPDEENEAHPQKVAPTPQDLLAREAAMAEKLLGDLIPEEPPAKKAPERPAPMAPPPPKPETVEMKPEAKVVEPPPIPKAVEEKAPQREEKPVEEKPVEAKPAEAPPAEARPTKDELSETVERVHALGVELVQIRNEILAAREKYAAKTKELEGLQEKLKGLLGQIG